MNLQTPDRDFDHLFPAFRSAYQQVLRRMWELTGHEWHMMEGYRSQERQAWLYASGRTRPGPIVTKKAHASWHAAGLAADSAPIKNGQAWYGAPRHWWELLRQVGREHGLINPAWGFGDLGHLQIADTKQRPAALAWVARGFPAG
jgi:hypothetical protein